MLQRIVDAVEGNDLDELVRIIDALADTREWDLLFEVRDRSLRALDRGRQLWPAASLAEYRLALDAPAEFAAEVLVDDAGEFALGPLPEVAASTHTWAELAPHVIDGPRAALAAHERVARGEVIDPTTVAVGDVLSVPLALAPWEPQYAVASYEAHRYEAPAPELPHGRVLDLASAGEPVDDPEVEDAFRDLVRPWTAGSDGRARFVAVDGTAESAIASLALAPDVRGAWIDAAEALALLAWVGASGGSHGRRRGTAAGRDLAWAAAGALCGLQAGESPEPDALGDALAQLRWVSWHAADVNTGWVLRIAVEDPNERIAWAFDASDPS